MHLTLPYLSHSDLLQNFSCYYSPLWRYISNMLLKRYKSQEIIKCNIKLLLLLVVDADLCSIAIFVHFHFVMTQTMESIYFY